MIESFKDSHTESFWHSGKSRIFPPSIHKRALLKLDMLHASVELRDLKSPPSNHLEALVGDLEGFYSIRINHQYRIIFRFYNGNATDVAIVDYH